MAAKLKFTMPCTEPNCKHEHTMEADLDDIKAKLEVAQPKQAEVHVHSESSPNASVNVSHDQQPEDPHETVQKHMPKGINFTQCKACEKKLKNPRYTKEFKTCPTCGANSVPRSSEICTTCGKKHEEWDESDINLEESDEE